MPPSVSNAQIWEALGSLRASQEAMRDEFRRESVNASAARAGIYQRLEDQNHRLGAVEEDIKEMKPAVVGLTTLRTKAGGMILALGVVGAILGALLTYFKEVLFAKIGW